MPKTIGGFVGLLVMSLITVAIGVAILSRTPIWVKLFPAAKPTAATVA